MNPELRFRWSNVNAALHGAVRLFFYLCAVMVIVSAWNHH